MKSNSELRINFVDFWPGFNPQKNIFYDLLSKRYKLILSKKPDILFCSVFGFECTQYSCTKILFSGENYHPNFNIYDYAIGSEWITYPKRFLRIPVYYITHLNEIKQLSLFRNPLDVEYSRREFCNFIYSNSIEYRESFFRELSKYKKIDSGGKSMNNIGYRIHNKGDFQKKYKFSIAFENTIQSGYTTEKIIDAKFNNTIPIYFGDPDIEKELNEESFINCNKFSSTKDIINHIKKIDEDDDLYLTMLNAPLFKKNIVEQNLNKLEEFLFHVATNKDKKPISQRYGRDESDIFLKYRNLSRWELYRQKIIKP